MAKLSLLVAICSSYSIVVLGSNEYVLEDFTDPQHRWVEMNDPVMGGRSTGTFRIEDGVGVFKGRVEDVPFLHAPGFIQARAIDDTYPDISSCQAFALTIRSRTDYAGYRFSFGNEHAPHGKVHAFGYKANVFVPIAEEEFVEVVLPFDDFTNYWDDATGDAIVTCHEDAQYCPTPNALQNLQRLTIWAEGVKGDVWLDVKDIKVIDCAQAASGRA